MLNQLIENNYKEILVFAKKITRRKDCRQATTLISETYLDLHLKTPPKIDKEFVYWFVRGMKLVHLSKWSNFNKGQAVTEATLEYDPGNEDWKNIELDIDKGEANESTRDLISELSHLTNYKARKYAELMEFKSSLPPHEKEIFDLHFEKGMSSRDIATLMERETGWKMSHMRYNDMIRNVKTKLNGSN